MQTDRAQVGPFHHGNRRPMTDGLEGSTPAAPEPAAHRDVSRGMRRVLAVAVVALGATVLAGWSLRSAAAVQVAPGLAPMTIATAASFIASGIAIVLTTIDAGSARRARESLGLFVLLLAAANLVEQIVDVDFGIDLASLQRWVDPSNPHPGRMSFNTAVSFLMCGTGLVALDRARRGIASAAVTLVVWGVPVVGIIGIAGYGFGTEYVYRWYGYVGMAVHTAIGMAVLGSGLVLAWRDLPRRREDVLAQPEAHIARVAAAWLVTVAAAAGFSGFVLMQQQTERTFSEMLLVALRSRIQLFESLLSLRLSNAQVVATRPALLTNLRTLAARPDDPAARAAVQRIVNSFTAVGWKAIAVFDANGSEIARSGSIDDPVDLEMPVDAAHDAVLRWHDGYVLRNRITLYDDATLVGSATIEQFLPIMKQSDDEIALLGSTAESGLCGRIGDMLACFPTRLRPTVFFLPAKAGTPRLPVEYGIAGGTGVIRTVDYRGKEVVAAYGPIGATGIGTVIKIDGAEIYRPVRDRIAIFAPILVVLVVIGALTLRARLRPLAGELVRSREALREQAARLEQSNTQLKLAMKTKDRFLATMSHELRTPLNAILGFSGVLLMKLPGPLTDEQEEQLRIIKKSGKHLLALISDLLDLARIESGRPVLAPERTGIRRLVDDIVAVLRTSAEAKGVAFETRVPGAEIEVRTDRRMLLQILLNLAGNAIKYTEHGKVTITVRPADAGGVAIAVEDTGVGIAPEDQARLFKAFERLDRDTSHSQSTGLGLYYSQKLAESIGATISLVSKRGEGSAFTLHLPADVPAAPPE